MRKAFQNPMFKSKFICMILALISLFVLVLCYYVFIFGPGDEITGFSVHSNDNALSISWIPPSVDICDHIQLSISDTQGNIYTKNFSPFKNHFNYTNGVHGEMYTVSVSALRNRAVVGETLEVQSMYLDYDKLPALPLVIINTETGADPTYVDEILQDEDGNVIGVSISNNEYLSGEVTISGDGLQTVSDAVKIKIRGNTSSAGNDKKSYKLKFEEAHNLIPSRSDTFCHEWVLLNNGNELKTYIGDEIGELCGVYDQHNMRFVNVILNGDYKGCYGLSQAASYDVSSAYISSSGYLFESDNTYWNNDGLYFRTQNQISTHGYTFKYPEITDISQPEVVSIQNYMQTLEDLLNDDDPHYTDYIDEDTFARWILARDLLGNRDGNGSNIYYYKYDLSEDNPTSSKLIVGNIWDFDSIFQMTNEWSASRRFSFYRRLFNQDSFNMLYENLWNELSPGMYSNIESILNDIDTTQSEALDESWALEEKRWNTEIASFADQKDEALSWFNSRIDWIDSQLNNQSAK